MQSSEPIQVHQGHKRHADVMRRQLLQEQLEEDAEADALSTLRIEHQRLKAVFEAMSKHHAQVLSDCSRLQRQNNILSQEVMIARKTVERLSVLPTYTPYSPGSKTQLTSGTPLSSPQKGSSKFVPADSKLDGASKSPYTPQTSELNRSLEAENDVILKLEPFLESVLPPKDAGSIRDACVIVPPPQTQEQPEHSLDRSSSPNHLAKTHDLPGPNHDTNKFDLAAFVTQSIPHAARIHAYQLNERAILRELQIAEEHNRVLCARLAGDVASGQLLQAEHVALIERMGVERTRVAERLQRRATDFHRELAEALEVSQNRVSDLVATRERLMVELEMVRIQLQAARQEADTATKCMVGLQADLACAKDTKSRLDAGHQDEMQRMNRTLQATKLRAFEAEQEVNMLRNELCSTQARLAHLARVQNETTTSVTNPTDQHLIDSQRATIAQLRQEVLQTRRANDDLQDKYATLQAQMESVSSELKGCKDEIDIVREVETSLRKTLAETLSTLDAERSTSAAERLRLELEHAEALSQAIENAADARLRLTRRVVLLEDHLVDSITHETKNSALFFT